MGVITEQTQCSAGPCWLCASMCKGSIFSLQNLLLQGTGRGCQHLCLRHIKYEFPAHKDFIIHHRLWFSSLSTLALLSGSRGSDQICHWQDHLGRKSAGRISTHPLPRSPCLLPTAGTGLHHPPQRRRSLLQLHQGYGRRRGNKTKIHPPLTKGPLTTNRSCFRAGEKK